MQKSILFFVVAVMFFAAGACWAQTCRSNIAATTGHLVGKTDGTVIDSKTKLMWKRCPEGYSYVSAENICSNPRTIEYTWANALALPASVNSSGFPTGTGLPNYKNWRLPNIKELQSIVEEKCFNPAINHNAFSVTSDGNAMSLWSNSPSVSTGLSWYIDLLSGNMVESARSELYGVRLVRDCTGTECD